MPEADVIPRKPNPDRRSFLAALLAAGASSVVALLSVPLVGFSLHLLWGKTTEVLWSDIGPSGGVRGCQPKSRSSSVSSTTMAGARSCPKRRCTSARLPTTVPGVVSAVCPQAARRTHAPQCFGGGESGRRPRRDPDAPSLGRLRRTRYELEDHQRARVDPCARRKPDRQS